MALIQAVLNIAGLVLLFHVLSRMIIWTYGTFFRKINLKKYFAKSGKSWALITGSTDGIGLAFARVTISVCGRFFKYC